MTSVLPEMLMSSVQLGALIGLTDRQVRNHARSGLFPSGKGQKKFDARICIPAYIKYLLQGREQDATLWAEKLKLTTARRHDIEQRTATRARELIPVGEVANTLYSVIGIFTTQLDGLGGRTCNELAVESEPAVIKDTLFRETRRIRNIAADQIETLAAATTPKRKNDAAPGGADGG